MPSGQRKRTGCRPRVGRPAGRPYDAAFPSAIATQARAARMRKPAMTPLPPAMPPQLDAMLQALEQALPALVASHPAPGDFWNAFMQRLDDIEACAPPELDLTPRLNAMLAPHGMRIALAD